MSHTTTIVYPLSLDLVARRLREEALVQRHQRASLYMMVLADGAEAYWARRAGPGCVPSVAHNPVTAHERRKLAQLVKELQARDKVRLVATPGGAFVVELVT